MAFFLITHHEGSFMKLVSRFGRVNQVRRDRPLTREELMQYVPSVFSENKHESRSDRYTWIPTITILENLQREGFEPFFACQTRVRDQGRREHTKHMLRLRRTGQLTGHQVPEIILLNSHDGSSSYQMLPGLFRGVCTNGLVCGQSFGEVGCRIKGMWWRKLLKGLMRYWGYLTGWRRNVMPCSPLCYRHQRNRRWRGPLSTIVLVKTTSPSLPLRY